MYSSESSVRYPHIRRSTWSLLTIDFLLNLIEDCSWIKTFTKTCYWQNVNNCTFSLLSSIYICSKYYFQLCTVLDIHGKPMNVGIFSFQSIIQNLVLYYSIYHVHIHLPSYWYKSTFTLWKSIFLKSIKYILDSWCPFRWMCKCVKCRYLIFSPEHKLKWKWSVACRAAGHNMLGDYMRIQSRAASVSSFVPVSTSPLFTRYSTRSWIFRIKFL